MTRPLVIVSNRLPIVVKNDADGGWNVEPSSGGLVTALRPILKQRGGAWIGWLGAAEGAPVDELLGIVGEEIGCRFTSVELSTRLVNDFYYGFSNETLWPLFHDLLGHTNFDLTKWLAYEESNAIFAKVVHEADTEGAIVWVNDYQLMLVGSELRKLEFKNPLAFFLHIPFPSPDIFARLPWREKILRGLLCFDLIGLQVTRDLLNFVACVREFIPDAEVERSGAFATIRIDGATVRAGAFPISIDSKSFEETARSEEVRNACERVHREYPDRHILLGVDRLDYTKGLIVKCRAYERALEKYPDLHRNVTLLQIVIPSRQDIPEYSKWKARMDQTIGEINGRFGRRGWMPLHYFYRAVDFTDLLGYYRAADVCLVTPLKDGMNLVAKEYCASCIDDNGVLVLSEFAGAAAQLQDALIVNPNDNERMADAIYEAAKMPLAERQRRMARLRQEVRTNDVFVWVANFLGEFPGA
ncbi:trehalose-6-phosphate synthase [soil metagenome]